MLRRHAHRLNRLARVADLSVSGLLFWILVSLDPSRGAGWLTQPEAWRLAAVGAAAVAGWLLAADHFGIYGSQRRRRVTEQLSRVCAASLVSALAISVVAFLSAAPVVRSLPLVFGVNQALALALLRLPILMGLRALRRHGRNYRDVLVVGTGSRATEVRSLILRHPEWGIRIAGFVDEKEFPVDPYLRYEPIHKLSDVPELMKAQVVDEVILACPISMLPQVSPLVRVCGEAGVPVTLLSDLFGELPPPRPTRLGLLPALSFAPVHHSRLQLAIKRGVDLLGATLLLVATAPILAAAALAIRLSSPGPMLFRQQRCGLYGRRFEVLKLRSMDPDAPLRRADLLELNEMDGPVFKMREDPRITPVGRFLRKWSIDELPQLWNVLRGDMSLVGPRPPLPEEVEQYRNFERRRLSMRPGITCLWQVGGRNELSFADWVRLDIEYIDTWSPLRDLEILLKTVPAVLTATGR